MKVALACPRCGADFLEEMPADACVIRVYCPACGAAITPLANDCCVFCSYGERRCASAPRSSKPDSE